LGSVFLLVCLLFLFINLPVGKRIVKNKVQSYLSGKLKTRVIIGSVNYSLPQWLEINGVYAEDQKKDTLLFGEKILADIDMVKLIWGNTDIEKIVFKNIFFNISREEKDSAFNYQFVLDAFAGNKPAGKVDMDTAGLKLTLNRLVLDDVSLRFKDKNEGTDFYARIKSLDASLNKFRPDRINFAIKDFTASGIDFLMTTYKETKKDTVFIIPADTIARPAYGLYISAGTLDIRDANVTVENKISGMYYTNKVTHLALDNALFDLDRSLATGDYILLDSSFVRFTNPKQTVVKTPAKDTTTYIPWMIKAKQVSFTNNIIQFDDNNLAKTDGFDAGHFNVKEFDADISEFMYSIERTAGMVKQLRFKDSSGLALDTLHVNFLMTDTILSARELYVKTPQSLLQNHIEIKYDSLAGISANPRNSLISAVLKNSTLAFNDLYLVAPELKRAFPPDQFANNLVHFNTELRGNLAQVYVPYLQLVGFSGSSLNAHGTLYNLTDASKFYYDLYIDNGSFKKSDILKFVPPENRQSLEELPAIINLRGRVKGNKESLVSDIQTSGQGLALSGRFSLKNISDPAKLKYDFAISSSSFSRDFILGFIPPGTLPPEIRLPEKTYATGTISGNANNLVMDLKLNGSYGPLTVKGFIRNIKDPKNSAYDLFVTTSNYDIGKLISQDSVLGKVTGSFKLKGTGFDYKTMRSDITASVKQLQYKNYNYKNAEVTANFNNGIIDSKGSINDSSLVLQYDIKANVQGEYPSVNGFVNVDTAQLQKLNLYNDTLNFSLYANVQASNLKPRNLDINTRIDSINLQLGKDFYRMDTVSLIATSSGGVDNINFDAPFANLHANGAFDYDRIGDAVVQYVNHYYKVSNTATAVIPEQQVTFEGVIKKHPFPVAIVPGLTAYDDINFKGSFASAKTDSALNLTASVPYLAYQNNAVRNGSIDIRSRNESINYAINFDTLNYVRNTFYGTRLSGSAAHDSLSINTVTQDNKKTDWFGLNGSLFVKDDSYSFRLKDSLLLNYERWNAAPDNYISYSPAGLIVHNFLITSDTARIFINSRQEIVNSPIDIAIDDFNLKSISSVLNRDTLFASGILDAKMEVADLNKTIPAFTGNFTITGLELMQQPLGTVTGFAAKQSEDNITATLTLQGYGNDIAAKGNYYLNNEEQQFDAFVDIKKLNLASLQGFTFGSIRNATGNVYGNMNLQGKFSEPIWKGELNFDTARFTIAQLNTPFKINSQKIVFDHPGINFSNFIVLDSLDNQMKIDGSVSLNQGSVFDLKLDINATDFILLNAPRAINNEFYGFASVDVNALVTGTSVSPDIQGGIFVNDNSDVTIMIPERSYGKDASKTIVRFIDRDTFDVNPPVIPFMEENENRAAFAQFLNYNLNIEVKKNAALKIIIDPVTGDEIRVQGDAQLTAGLDPGGNLILAGTYELDQGYYVFNYQFLQRKFDLVKGSTIIFAGEPMRARVNITASYTVNTSAKDLLDNEVGTVDPLLANAFNQKVPFKVILYLTGELSRPTIKFDIQLPEESTVMNSDLRTTIENKLSQIRGDEAATAKQVFSLLLLGRFVGEQSSDFFRGNGNDFNDLARQSVSQFLSGALNEIAGNLLKGVDIDLNLNSYTDYSDGGSVQRTDLNVALSKTFLDDRLTIWIGKDFGVQGQDAAKANNNFIPDITVGYKLTKDGKYLLKAYRKNQFEVILDGYVVETGIGFIVTMDYDRFNELFKKKKK